MRKIREKLAIFFVSLLALFVGAQSVEPSQCIAPLGMENGMIQNQDITASSSFDHGNVGPHHGRVRNELNGGAWCPQAQATPDAKEWIEIDLHTVHTITATETQGRFGNGQGVEFAEFYILEYFRPRLNKWVRYRTKSNSHLLEGNVNTYLEAKTVLDPPIWASKIRFLPYSSHKRTVCMRVEIYGCRWSDGIISYTMPQGDKRGTSWEFYDFAYDGHWDGEMLKYGLGQLVDGETAPDDFKLPFHQEELQGWIGWKNDHRNNRPIEIVFEFDKLREFRAVHLYTNNQFTREVQVFGVAKVFFSADGRKFKGEPINYNYIEDRIFENARNVSIKLHHRVGRFVKLQLYFAARWILLSEVSFESSLATGNFTEEEQEEEEEDAEPALGDIDSTNDQRLSFNVPRSNKDPGGFGPYLGIIVGVLVLLVLLMIIVAMFVVIQQKRYKNLQRPSQIADKATLYGIPPLDLINASNEYADIPDLEYSVPLQAMYTSPTDTIRKPSISSSSEQYYAAVDICKPDFLPPPPPISSPRPPLSSPRPTRLKNPPKYMADSAYIGP